MNKRLDAIMRNREHYAKFNGGAAAKRYRGNLKRAATAARETASLFANLDDYEDRRLLADDAETLRKAATLLQQLANDFEVAQRKAEKIKADAEAKAKAQHDAEIKQAMIELFGTDKPEKTSPESGLEHAVITMAKDLAYFDRNGAREYAQAKGYTDGLLSGAYTTNLQFFAERNNVMECAKLIAQNRVSSRWPGRPHLDSYDQRRWWHSGWDDFMDWSEARQQVKDESKA